MSTQESAPAEDYAIIVANDLHSGRTVFRTTNNRWSEKLEDARLFEQLEVGQSCLRRCVLETAQVVDPYLVATDSSGHPIHIREIIRVLGPSIQTVGKLRSVYAKNQENDYVSV